MSLTVYADVILPGRILSAGARGKQLRKNSRTSAQSGVQKINVDWSRTLRQYEFGFVPLSVAEWQTVEGLHEVTEGGAYGFLLSDPKDNTCLLTDGLATLVGGTIYQLAKRYVAVGSSRYKDRNITRPLAAGFAIYTSGTPIVTYTLDSTTGRITIPSAPSAATLTWSGTFYIPVHFENDSIDWELVRSGPASTRLMAGPQVVLTEVRE